MYFNIKTLPTLALAIILNSCFLLTNQVNATSVTTSPEFITLPQNNRKQINRTGIVKKIDNIAKQITVKIDNSDNPVPGSGVIIAHQGDTYYVLTAKHVLCPGIRQSGCEPDSQHQIITPDGETHQLDSQTIQTAEYEIDLAIAQFKSNKTYSVATLANYQWSNQWVFTTGFAHRNQEKDTPPTPILTAGKVFPREQAYFVVKDAYSLRYGNELVYTNDSYPGMGGGAILDSQGRLIGIQTGTEAQVYFDDEGNYSQYNIGYSLGIPIKTLLSLLYPNKTQLQPQWLQIETTAANPVTPAEAKTIKEQLQILTEPSSNSDITSYINYGNQLWRHGKYEQATVAFQEAIEIEPNFHQAYYAMGLNFLDKGDYQQAATALEQAIKINERPYYYWHRLGQAYKELQQYQQVLSAYNSAIAINPQYTEAYHERADIYIKIGDYQRALANYQTLMESSPPDDYKKYLGRGFIYAKLGEYQQAITDYNKAIDIIPSLAEAYYKRGLAYGNLGNMEQTQQDWEKAIKLYDQQDKTEESQFVREELNQL